MVEWLLKEGDLEEEAANDDDDDVHHDATLRDGNERKDPDGKAMGGPPSLEESASLAKNHDNCDCDEMDEKVEKLSLG